MTGTVAKADRAEAWTTPHKRIFFATPQAFKNDAAKGTMSVTCASERHLLLKRYGFSPAGVMVSMSGLDELSRPRAAECLLVSISVRLL